MTRSIYDLINKSYKPIRSILLSNNKLSVNARRFEINSNNMKLLLDALKVKKRVKTLFLNGVISDINIKYFNDLLKNTQWITTLCINNLENNINHLDYLIQNNQQITELMLYIYETDDIVIHKLEKILKSKNSIAKLYLNLSPNINLKYLFDGLKNNQTIIRLNLEGFGLDNINMKYLGCY